MTIFQQKLATCAANLATAALLLVGSGCVVGPKYHAPAPQAPAPAYKESTTQFNDNGPWTVAQPSDAMLRGKWWEIFNDPELNALEEQLNIDNQNIKEFFENFMEARSVVREAHAQFYPTITAAPSITHARTSANQGGVSTGGVTSTNSSKLQTTVYQLPMEASWSPDLWGKVRNTVRAAQYSAQLSAAD